MTAKELIKNLQENYEPDEDLISFVYTRGDFPERSEHQWKLALGDFTYGKASDDGVREIIEVYMIDWGRDI
tara:strand:+ start:418 stop:630 length:213 start_codon:yes stop_codon:yes gene_type:complete